MQVVHEVVRLEQGQAVQGQDQEGVDEVGEQEENNQNASGIISQSLNAE